VNSLNVYSTVRLAPVLLPAGTHCGQLLCRRTDISNSTGILFDSLCWIYSFESICLPNRFE